MATAAYQYSLQYRTGQSRRDAKKSRRTFGSQVERQDQYSRSVATHDDGEVSLELRKIHGSKMARIRKRVGEAAAAFSRIPGPGNARHHQRRGSGRYRLHQVRQTV